MKKHSQKKKTILSLLLAAACLGAPGVAHAIPQGAIPHALLAPPLEGKININTATAEQLELLPGIGPATAKKVLSYREKHAFKDITHIIRIKGIGRKTFRKLQPYLAVKGPTTLRVAGE